MSKRTTRYVYSGRAFDVSDAAGIDGILIRSGGTLLLRVYDEAGEFTDYDIVHDDLCITVSKDAPACFYSDGQDNVIDHSPSVLGLKKVSS